MTSKLQALDVVVNRLFKDHLKQLYSKWLLTGDHALSQTKRIKKPNTTLYCQWIVTSWQCSSSEVILKGFKKCCISDAVDELIMTCCGMTVKGMGMVKINVRKMKSLPSKMDTLQ
jgi:hypothetical protein